MQGIFPDVTPAAALAEHHATSKALGLPRTVLHHHRHSFAVMHLKRACDHQWLKNQLGHAPQSTLIYSVYGTYIGAQKLTAGQRAQMPESEKIATTLATTRQAASR